MPGNWHIPNDSGDFYRSVSGTSLAPPAIKEDVVAERTVAL